MVVGFVLGAALASHVGWLRLLFTPRRQMRDEVAARARAVFFDSRVHHTAGDTGLLIYVSLYERMAAVLADQSIMDKLGQAALDELCAVSDRASSGISIRPTPSARPSASPANDSRRSCRGPQTTSTNCPTRW